ncbi:MAG TPA: GH25 family lysozyme [Drouetiella sp.]
MTTSRTKNLTANRLFGIDVSHHNGTIDWNKVKAAGVNFVFIKASEGLTLGDDQYATNIAKARALGIPAGAYHFFIPTSSVSQQVTNFCNQVGRLQPGDLPPVLDVEVPSRWVTAPEEAAQMHTAWLAMTVDRRVAKVIEWMDGVEKQLGVTPILYASSNFVRDTLGGSPKLKKYRLWVANYKVSVPTIPAPFTDWAFWQDSETGTVSGITGNVDTDWFNGTAAQLNALKKTVLPFGARVTHRIRGIFRFFFGWMFR